MVSDNKPPGWTDEMYRIHVQDVRQRIVAGEQACPSCGWSVSVLRAGGLFHSQFAEIACGPDDPCEYVSTAAC
jgi:hypothetical protein